MSEKKQFTEWLNKKLRELNTDENVFGEYIISILEDAETADERQDGLEGILSEMIEVDLDKVVAEIINEWNKCVPLDETVKSSSPAEDIDTKLAKLLENQHIATTVQRQYTEEELRIRDQILSQYSQVEYEDEYADDDDDGPRPSGSADLVKNTNASDVAQLAKEKREQARLDSAAKKEKDKEDRAKQKQMREDKKEKRKTVKGERRR